MRGGCAEGNGSFRVGGRSLAQAEAFAIATSFAEALVEANVCGFCEIAADFIAETFEEISIQAAAEAEIFLEGQANGGAVQADADALAEAFVSASATAFAQVCAPIIVQGPSCYSAILTYVTAFCHKVVNDNSQI